MQTDLQTLLNHLTAIQRRRIRLRYLIDSPMTITDIAKAEGVRKQSVHESVALSIKKLKKLGWIVS